MTAGPLTGASPVSVESRWMPEVARHLTLALSKCVRQLERDGVPAPREVEELTTFLLNFGMRCQNAPHPLTDPDALRHNGSPERLLVTKAEAAERLGVSVRTVERLVATGRLQQVHVERLVRFRVWDLEAFVNSLG